MKARSSLCWLLLLLPLILVLCGCWSPQDEVMAALPAEGEGVLYSHGTFQDYTDYGEYQYSGITEDDLKESGYFQVVEAADVAELTGYLENFNNWVQLAENCGDCNLAQMYDFSADMLREGDYFYLESRVDSERADYDARKYDDYTIYYFSLENQMLYYFHSNI